MQTYSPDKLIEVLKFKNYKVFTDGRPNIVGIRKNTRSAGTFDDACFVWWEEPVKKDGTDETVLKRTQHNYTVTTDPGLTYLVRPLKGSKGTAILVPGQYVDCWNLGIHRGKQEALIQTGGPVKVYRDNNKDGILDMDPNTIETGYFGINLHHGSLTDEALINGWSAGCQVWRYNTPHSMMIENFKRLSRLYKFKGFTYTLLLEQEIK